MFPSRDVCVRNLAERVHAGIGSTSAMYHDAGSIADAFEGAFDMILDSVV
jgi:hypothetical protein